MSTAPKGWDISDSSRDAQRYKRLLSALDYAIAEIRAMEMEGSIGGTDAVLDRLLPVVTETLNAQDAFAVLLREDVDGEKYLEITLAYPREDLRGCRLEYTERFQKLVGDGVRQVIDPYWEKQQDIIPGLEVFDATSAVLVRMESADETRIVGVCNKRNPELEVFLAADGMSLDIIVELVAAGARVGERRRRELESIQKISAAIGAELDLDELLPMIARGATEVFDAPATSLFLWDESRENLVVKAKWGLSDEYMQRQRIPRKKVDATIESIGELQPLPTPDLQLEPLGDIDLIKSERLCTVLSAPLLVSDQLIGILNIYSKDKPRQSTPGEIELSQIFANQAAIAIHNASLYDRTKRQGQYRQALYDASKAITAGSAAEGKQVLDRLVEQAVERITGIEGPKAVLGLIQLYDETTNELRFESVYPLKVLPELEARLGERWILDKDKALGGRIGIAGRAVLEKKPQRVENVWTDPDYLEFNVTIRSELDVPLFDGNRVIGVLSVESDRVGAFDEDDEQALKGLAELAVIAIKNAEQAEQLSRADAVALMGAWGANIVHDVNREVGAIRRAIFLLQRRSELPPEVKERLQEIDRYAASLALPELPELPPESGRALELRDAPVLDEVIVSEATNLQQIYPSISLQLELGCQEIRVAIHERWLRRIVHHLIRNAVKAMPPERETRLVVIRTIVQNSMAEIEVEDTGEGVRPGVMPLLFKQPIPHPDGRQGRGLLLVRFVVEQHGGHARLVWSRPGEGACFALVIPIVQVPA